MRISYYPKILPYAVLNLYPQFFGMNMNRLLNGPGVAGHFFTTMTSQAFSKVMFGVKFSDTSKTLDWLADERSKGYKMEYSIYEKEDLIKQPYKLGVRLYYFRGDPDKPFVLFCPPGGFLMDGNICDGLHLARELCTRGYNFFIINYTQCAYPFHGGFRSARQDVSRALKFIMENDFPINKEGFAIAGGSAGGYMTLMMGTENFGCKAMGDPVPSTLISLYPIADNKNLIERLMFIYLSRPGCVNQVMNPTKHIASDCPPVFYWRGGNDILVSNRAMISYGKALDAKGIPHEFHQFKNGKHADGLQTGLDGEGWIEDAIKFWESHR